MALYQCETWALSKQDRVKLEAFELWELTKVRNDEVLRHVNETKLQLEPYIVIHTRKQRRGW